MPTETNTNTVNTTSNPSATEPKIEAKSVDFGTGKYSNVGRELFRDSQRLLAIDETQAERLSRAFMADMGRVNMKIDSVKISKPNKDGYITLREAAKMKDVKMTNAMRLAKICTSLDEVRKLGVDKFVKLQLDKELLGWLNETA